MAKKLTLSIVTLERELLSDEVDSVTLPTKAGEITILPGHLPIVSTLDAGELWGRKGKERFSFAVSGGFLELAGNRLTVLADEASLADEIQAEKLEAAKKEAARTLDDRQADPASVVSARRALRFIKAQSTVARRRR